VSTPNIMPMEIVVVSAGFLVLCVAPALVGWLDAARRRRAEEATRRPPAAPAEAARVFEAGQEGGLTPGAGEPPAFAEPVSSSEPAAAADLPLEQEGRIATAGPSSPVAGWKEEPAPPVSEPTVAVAAPHLKTEQAYEFCLQDLRRARILDLPPPAVRNDPERHRVWEEGSRLASQHQGRIDRSRLAGPYMPQSACYGTAETHGSALQLRFWLFSDLWPVKEGQAIGDAVFEIDGSGAELRSWLEPHKPVQS
jgi:hypothetical protein